MLIDFSRTGYIDSSGLGALVSLSSGSARRGASSGCPASTRPRSLFELTSSTPLAIANAQQALASFSADRSDALAAPPLRPPLPGCGRERLRHAGDASAPERGRVHREAVETGHPHCLAGHDTTRKTRSASRCGCPRR